MSYILARLVPALFNFNSFLFNWTVFGKKRKEKNINVYKLSINIVELLEEIRRARWTLFKNASRLSSLSARNNGIVSSLDEDIKYNIMKFFWNSYLFMKMDL